MRVRHHGNISHQHSLESPFAYQSDHFFFELFIRGLFYLYIDRKALFIDFESDGNEAVGSGSFRLSWLRRQLQFRADRTAGNFDQSFREMPRSGGLCFKGQVYANRILRDILGQH